MINIKHPEALSWKHNYMPGIRTRSNKLIGWPDTLSPFPTQAQVNRWEAEWLLYKADDKRIEEEFNSNIVLQAVMAGMTVTNQAKVKNKYIADRRSVQ